MSVERDVELRSEFLQVAYRVFMRSREPLSAKAVIERARREGMLSDKIAGRTPSQTMKSKLSVHIRKYGDRSPFVRTKPGRFYLRALLTSSSAEYVAQPLRPPPARENIVAFPTSRLEGDRFQGVKTAWTKRYRRLFGSSPLETLPRLDAEERDDVKQVLTYVLVTRGTSVLSYRRGVYNRVEDSLRGARCVGFGGHVRESDRSLFSDDFAGISEGAVRELNEELKFNTLDRRRLSDGEGLRVVALLNDDSSAVGRRHFAVVMQFEVADESWNPERAEKSITQLRWITPTDGPRLRLHEFEYWSQLCLREFFPDLLSGSPGFTLARRSRLRPPRVLCFVGGLGSGKSEAADVLRRQHSYAEVNSGLVLAQLLGMPPIPESPRNEFQERAFRFISRDNGPVELGNAISVAVEATGSERVLIDGIRHRATLEAVRDGLRPRGIGVVYVHSTPDLALRLYESRLGERVDPLSFFELQSAPVEVEAASLMSIADGVVYNWFGKTAFRGTVLDMCDAIPVGDSS
ncbi:MAG: HTH domain-containing protein [Actinomycetota bacterium]|nr:HTH domain-containing protein [Actinomycetota bacterium]